MMRAMDISVQSAKSNGAPAVAESAAARTPLCFVADDEPTVRHFLSLILHGAGLDTEEFADGASMRTEVETRSPDLIFLNVGLESADAIETIVALGKRGFTGFVQLMST